MVLNRISNWEAWDPFKEMGQLQSELNQLFSNFPGDGKRGEFPQFNVWDNNDGLLMISELPGVEAQDIDIVVVGDTLTIKGTKKAPELGEKDSYSKRELFYGNFSRSIKLPYKVDPNQVEAQFHDGILRISLNRPEEEKPKKINITVN
jgi:HSP20 family protein